MKIKAKKSEIKFILELSEEEFFNIRFAAYLLSNTDRYNEFVPEKEDNKTFKEMYLKMLEAEPED